MSDKITVEFAADTSKLTAGTAKVKADIESVGKAAKIQKAAMSELTATVASYASAGALAAAGAAVFRRELEKYGALQDAIEQTGMGAENLQRFSAAAEDSGTNLAALTSAAAKLSKALVFGEDTDLAVRAIKALGLSVEDLRKQSPDVIFTTIATAIGGIENPTQRSAAAIAVFGKNGKDLVPAMVQIHDGLGKMITLTAEETKNVDDLGDAMGALVRNADALAGKLISSFVPALRAVGKEAKENPGIIAGLIQGVKSANPAVGLALEATSGLASGDPKKDGSKEPAPQVNKPGLVDFQAMIDDKAAKKDAEGAAALKGIVDAGKKAQSEQLQRLKETSEAQKEAARIRHDAALQAMEDEKRLGTLEKERATLQRNRDSTKDPLDRAKYDKDLAAKEKEVSDLRKTIADNKATEAERKSAEAQRAGGEAQQASEEAKKAAEERNKKLPAQLALDEMLEKSSNYQNGKFTNVAGLRGAARRAALAQQREARRRERGIGGPSVANAGNSAAERLAEKKFGERAGGSGAKTANDAAHEKGFYKNDSTRPDMTPKPKPEKDPIEKLVEKVGHISKTIDKRLPKKEAA